MPKIKSIFWLFRQFFNQNQPRFIILGVVFFILLVLSSLPYFNLVLNKTLSFFLVWLLGIFYLKLPAKVSIVFALTLLGVCPFLLILKSEHLAEELANLVFGLLVIGTVQMFIKSLKN